MGNGGTEKKKKKLNVARVQGVTITDGGVSSEVKSALDLEVAYSSAQLRRIRTGTPHDNAVPHRLFAGTITALH